MYVETTHRRRLEKMMDERFPDLKEYADVKEIVLDVLVWRDIRLGGFEDLALIVRENGGLDRFLEFELEMRELAEVNLASDLLSDESLSALVKCRIGTLAAGLSEDNDDDDDDGHSGEYKNEPDEDAANGKNLSKDDKARGDEGKSADAEKPSDPKSDLGGSLPKHLGDDTVKAANPTASEAVKIAEAPAKDGPSGAAAESTNPEALIVDPKDTLMEENVQKGVAVSKHQSEPRLTYEASCSSLCSTLSSLCLTVSVSFSSTTGGSSLRYDMNCNVVRLWFVVKVVYVSAKAFDGLGFMAVVFGFRIVFGFATGTEESTVYQSREEVRVWRTWLDHDLKVTPWSVFQDGSNGEPAGQRRKRVVTKIRTRRTLSTWIRATLSDGHIYYPSFECRIDLRWSAPRVNRRMGSYRSTSDRDASSAPIRFPPDNFKHSLTLFSKSFSSFTHGTCSISGPSTTGLSPSTVPHSRGLRLGPPLRMLLQTTIRMTWPPNSQVGLFPVRSPLLGESLPKTPCGATARELIVQPPLVVMHVDDRFTFGPAGRAHRCARGANLCPTPWGRG
ncbi:hypothetical protein ACS0TY_006407 [Phlomoides rotata]